MKPLVWTEWQDAIVTKIYSTQGWGERRAAFKQHIHKLAPRTKQQAYERAKTLGIIQPLKKPAPWSNEEMDILEAHAHRTDKTVQAKLRAAGYDRTIASIHVYRYRHAGGVRQAKIDAGVFTANQAGEIVGANSKSVCYWIQKGWLKAKRGQVHGPTVTWEIKAADLRNFVINHVGYCDFTRADKYALIDLLCPTHGAKEAGKIAA